MPGTASTPPPRVVTAVAHCTVTLVAEGMESDRATGMAVLSVLEDMTDPGATDTKATLLLVMLTVPGAPTEPNEGEERVKLSVRVGALLFIICFCFNYYNIYIEVRRRKRNEKKPGSVG